MIFLFITTYNNKILNIIPIMERWNNYYDYEYNKRFDKYIEYVDLFNNDRINKNYGIDKDKKHYAYKR